MITVSANNESLVTADYKNKDFYNPKTKLSEHPFDERLAMAMSFIYDELHEKPIISHTFRNYPVSGGAQNSKHKTGHAIDFILTESSKKKVINWIINKEPQYYSLITFFGVKGFGIYDVHLHFDTRESVAIWDSRNQNEENDDLQNTNIEDNLISVRPLLLAAILLFLLSFLK